MTETSSTTLIQRTSSSPTVDGKGIEKEFQIHEPLAEPRALHSVVENDIYLLGSQFAILCQFAHPALEKGNYLHLSFADRIPQRLRNTARFLNVAVCGNEEEKRAIFSVIQKYDAKVKGDDYTADDPELGRLQAFFDKMDKGELENLLRESAIFGTSLRMPPDMWSEDLDAFWSYWDYNIATLEVTDVARSLAKDILYPRNLPMSMAWTLPVARMVTVNWLPRGLAREYNLQPTLSSRAAHVAFSAWVKTVYPLLPASVRGRRHAEYMEHLEKAVERINQMGHWAGIWWVFGPWT
ncbi:hypothetical protein BDW69DRAFT_193826 [Aspergillus filifer]